MEKIKKIAQPIIDKVRYSPTTSGLAFEKYGKSTDIKNYSDREITEMIYGIYTHKKLILTDGDYFIDLNTVVEIVCVLDEVTYFKKPTQEDYKTNKYNSINNIRTFYVRSYLLVTSEKTWNTNRHEITNLLCKIGAIRRGNNNFKDLFSLKNYYKTLQGFKQGSFPKDLYHPIKRYINGLFFQNDYRINNFKVEGKIKIEEHSA